jgi:hypothetical protein
VAFFVEQNTIIQVDVSGTLGAVSVTPPETYNGPQGSHRDSTGGSMKGKKYLMGAALTVLASSSVNAQQQINPGADFENATSLHTNLQVFLQSVVGNTYTPQQLVDADEAYAYTIGVADAVNGTLYCYPPNSTRGQTIAIVEKFLSENPEKWAMSSDTLIIVALARAYPCPKKS